MRLKLIKTHENIEKILINDIKSNNRNFEVILLKKLIYVWCNSEFKSIFYRDLSNLNVFNNIKEIIIHV